MRIIGGYLRNRRLRCARDRRIRPTTGLVRKAMFDMLAPVVRGAKVLDLCAGTGALGIEALSRGALSVVFVEKSPAACLALRQNLASMAAAEATRVICGDALKVAESLREGGYTLLLMDPPYRWSEAKIADLLSALGRHAVLAAGATVVCERPAAGRMPAVDGFRLLRQRTYGATTLNILAFEEPER